MKVFYEKDADLNALQGLTIALIGYGNQGRAQALNLRDSGLRVIVGNRDDAYAETCRRDGFAPMSIGEAVRAADVVMVMLPDEVQQGVYEAEIAPNLHEGQTLS